MVERGRGLEQERIYARLVQVRVFGCENRHQIRFEGKIMIFFGLLGGRSLEADGKVALRLPKAVATSTDTFSIQRQMLCLNSECNNRKHAYRISADFRVGWNAGALSKSTLRQTELGAKMYTGHAASDLTMFKECEL